MQLELCKRLCTNSAGTSMAVPREGTGQESSPSLSPVSLSLLWAHRAGLLPQPAPARSLGSSKEGAEFQSEGRRWCRAHGGWLSLSPALPQLRQGLCSEPEPETRTFPNPGVFDLPAFWFSCGCLLCVTVHYFRNGCRLSKGAVGKFRLMGNLLAQTKSQSSHKTLQTFSQLCYITRESEQLWIISQLSFLSFYSSATVAPFFPIRRNLINILYPY